MSTAAELIAQRLLARRGAKMIDPATIAALIQLAMLLLQQWQNCQNRPTALDLRRMAAKPNAMQRLAVRRQAIETLGRKQFNSLGGQDLVHDTFETLTLCSDSELGDFIAGR